MNFKSCLCAHHRFWTVLHNDNSSISSNIYIYLKNWWSFAKIKTHINENARWKSWGIQNSVTSQHLKLSSIKKSSAKLPLFSSMSNLKYAMLTRPESWWMSIMSGFNLVKCKTYSTKQARESCEVNWKEKIIDNRHESWNMNKVTDMLVKHSS